MSAIRTRTSSKSRSRPAWRLFTLHNMPDFWPASGYRLLDRGDDGRLRVTDDYLRAYFQRPELALIAESCQAERALHARLDETPRAEVPEQDLAAIEDEDARENYRV